MPLRQNLVAWQDMYSETVEKTASEADVLFLAIRKVLKCSPSKAVEIVSNNLGSRVVSTDSFAADLLKSPEAHDALSKSELKEVQEHLDNLDDHEESAKAIAVQIGKLKKVKEKKREPIKLKSEGSMNQNGVQSVLPARIPAKIRKDNFNARWIIFYGPPSKEGKRWSKSKSWGPSGADMPCVKYILLAMLEHHKSLTGDVYELHISEDSEARHSTCCSICICKHLVVGRWLCVLMPTKVQTC